MNHEQLLTLIRERGPLEVASMVRIPMGVGVRDGLNLTNWRVLEKGGALLFVRVDADDVYTSEMRVLCVNAEDTPANRETWGAVATDSPEPTALFLTPFNPAF